MTSVTRLICPRGLALSWSQAINTNQLIISIIVINKTAANRDTGKGKLEPTWSWNKMFVLWWIWIYNSFQYITIYNLSEKSTNTPGRPDNILVHLRVISAMVHIEARNFSLYSTNILSEVSSFYILYWNLSSAKLLAAHVIWLKPHHKFSNVSLLMRHCSHNSRAYWPEPQYKLLLLYQARAK